MYNGTLGEYSVEIVDEATYTFGSADNIFQYDLAYRHPEDTSHLSACGIKVYKDDLFRSAVVMATRLGIGVGPESAVIDCQNLLVICGNKVFNLSLPDLQLNWIADVDMAVCFAIYQYKDSYIVHGELDIMRLDRAGRIVWRVGARDIFVSSGHLRDTFKMHDEYIALTDWKGYRYKLFTLLSSSVSSLFNFVAQNLSK